MAHQVVTSPLLTFYDGSGLPLDNGYIYIGVANQNPETSPINVYWDSSLTQRAAQPVRTTSGFPMRNGAPARLYVDFAVTTYSVTVRDKNAVLVYSRPVSDYVLTDVTVGPVTDTILAAKAACDADVILANTSATIATGTANFQGTWSSVVTYSLGQSVAYNGRSYTALQSGINKTPDTNPTYWVAITVLDPAIVVQKDSSTGAAYMPSGTTAQRPVSPVNGYMRYNSDLLAMEAYVNGTWGSVGGGATGGGGDTVFIENEYTITTSYTIPAGKSAHSVGDANGNVTINSGVTVTVPSGARWVIS